MAQIERTKNASRNIVFGIALKLYQILIPFVMRTVMIYFMGIQYTGLNSLFASILQVLNLAELGVGFAMTFSMYKPIAEDDHKKICALMLMYRTYYRVIGLIIGVVGLAITPFIPQLIKSGVPDDVNIYILYLLNLAATVLTYWLFAYKNCLLNAHQRNDVISKVTLATNSVQYAFQLFIIIFLRNYYLYLIAMLATQALTNISTAIVVSIIYPSYKPEGKLENDEVREINKRIRDLFTAKIGSVIVNSADSIVISAFLGLEILAIYQNYYFILTAVIGFVGVVFSSCTAGIGNSLIVETKEKNFNDLNKFTFIISWIAGVCTCCLLGLYQPFMDIWVGKALELKYSAVICFAIYYFVFEINSLLWMYKDAGGIWREDRFRPLVTALTNLAMNLVLVQFWGIYGVILSTVLSTIIVGMPWLFHNLFTTLFDKEQLPVYLRKLLYYILITVMVCAVTVLICNRINLGKWSTLFVRLIICAVVPNVLYLLCYMKKSEFMEAVRLLDKMTKNKLHLERIFSGR